MSANIHQLDATGLLCPMPVIRTQNKVKQLQKGDRLEVICTDPGVLQDIPAWCRINGHKVIQTQEFAAEKKISILIEVC